MRLIDINVLLYLFEGDAEQHETCVAWFKQTIEADIPIGLSSSSIAGFVRVATNARVLKKPMTSIEAVNCIQRLIDTDCVLLIDAGSEYWKHFSRLVIENDARGNLVSDAHLAAIAIEHGYGVVTYDNDFSRFTKVRWMEPSV